MGYLNDILFSYLSVQLFFFVSFFRTFHHKDRSVGRRYLYKKLLSWGTVKSRYVASTHPFTRASVLVRALLLLRTVYRTLTVTSFNLLAFCRECHYTRCPFCFSINLLAFYHECRSLIGYATHVLFCDSWWPLLCVFEVPMKWIKMKVMND